MSSAIPDHIASFSRSDIIDAKPCRVPSSDTLPSDRKRKRLVKVRPKIEKKPKKEAKPKKETKPKAISSVFYTPTVREWHAIASSLTALHPHVVDRNSSHRKTMLETCGGRDSITDAVISTMLSQNTTDKNAKSAYASLKLAFGTWKELSDCDDMSRIEDAIRVAGLARTRAERIRGMLRTVEEERGSPSLEYVRDILSDDDVKKELGRFKGLGPKTISCVLLFALQRSEFPVDTHVHRISKMMGWVHDSATREKAYRHLNQTVPDELKMDLHCLLVKHGKCCHSCAANGRPQFPPEDGGKLKCPLIGKNYNIKKEFKNYNIKKEFIRVKVSVKIEERVLKRCLFAKNNIPVKVKKEHLKVKVKKEY